MITELATQPKTVTPEEYHSDRSAWSHSMMEYLREAGPAAAYGRFIADPQTIDDPEPTAALCVGSASHCRVFEPAEFALRFITGGPINPKTGKTYGSDTQKFTDWVAQHAGGKTVLSDQEAADIEAMALAVESHESAGRLCQCGGQVEQAFYWVDERTGVSCKCKPDKFIFGAGKLIVIDLKTTRNPLPGPFGHDAGKRGYHRQAAFYLDGLRANLPDVESVCFLIIAVRNEPPFEVCVYEVPSEAIDTGRQENDADLACIARMMKTGDWRHSAQSGVNQLESWAWNKARIPDIEKFTEFSNFETQSESDGEES